MRAYSGSSGTETTLFIDDPLEIVIGAGGARDFRHYIDAAGAKVAVYSRTSGGRKALQPMRAVVHAYRFRCSLVSAQPGRTRTNARASRGDRFRQRTPSLPNFAKGATIQA